MANHILILAAVMLIAGVFGGLINYYQMNQNTSDRGSLPRCIVIGVGASFLVPVFLDLVNSDLILEIQGDPSRLLIFTGFCLVAAIAARVLIVSMSDRLSREVALAKAQAEATQHELRVLQDELMPLIAGETEQDVLDDHNVELDSDLDEGAAKVLQALAESDFTFRSLPGLCRETEMDEATVSKTLAILVSKDLSGKVSGQQGMRWHLTREGRRMQGLLS
ncbi:hypothetical protein G8770_04135 [Aestuariicella hydrocarbonica]|uniref:YEATS-Like-Associating Three TM domain-containing protein n=1 Tax=Pseudomaricurvus hydrocarbonicus TaxID=1470433 RepID=A0A9E5MJ94_9GAMM|nr:YEATS-associated helix-containing protein [Aestuariicella hydrocarbonica]NHO64734.1 hypothetical protein [Aestuariicella hydrocarbonica]